MSIGGPVGARDPDDESEAPTRGWLRRPRWWGGGCLLLLVLVLLSALAAESSAHGLAVFLLVLWMAATAFLAARWLWRRLTYRIGVRLLISYLLIGALPFPILGLLIFIGGYLLIGQYASAELGDLTLEIREELVRLSEEAVELAAAAGGDAAGEAAAVVRLERGPRSPAELEDIELEVEWLLAGPAGVSRSAGAETLEVPSWAGEETVAGPFLISETAALAAVARRGEHLAAVLLPLDEETARRLGEKLWLSVRFLIGDVEVSNTRFTINTSSGDSGEEQVELELSELEASGDETPRPWLEGLWENRWVTFISASPELRQWRDGTPLPKRAVTALVITSPREAAADFFRSPYQIGRAVTGIFLSISAFFFFIYMAAVLMAALQIFAITRSTSRLSRGAHMVQAGELGYRIPVRRRDQLGDLAATFNRMTAAIERMLQEEAEKERLRGELELAREIQQSLLPSRQLRYGPLAVHAYFRPATEVGGDYFDLFPLDDERLLLAIGDVAGHGLSTGLMMAMVKSAVATLVREGHRGAALLERFNRFMLEQPRSHRMVALALAELDPRRSEVEIVSAGHPPAFLLTAAGAREVLLSSLPAGAVWRRPPAAERLSLGAGDRLVFYSDGLVEALDRGDEPFGFERLRRTLESGAGRSAAELVSAILAALDAHVGERALEDDLTVLVIEHGGPAAGPSQ